MKTGQPSDIFKMKLHKNHSKLILNKLLGFNSQLHHFVNEYDRFIATYRIFPNKRGGAYINWGAFITLYQDKLTTDKKPTVGYSIPDEIPTTCFQLCELV